MSLYAIFVLPALYHPISTSVTPSQDISHPSALHHPLLLLMSFYPLFLIFTPSIISPSPPPNILSLYLLPPHPLSSKHLSLTFCLSQSSEHLSIVQRLFLLPVLESPPHHPPPHSPGRVLGPHFRFYSPPPPLPFFLHLPLPYPPNVSHPFLYRI